MAGHKIIACAVAATLAAGGATLGGMLAKGAPSVTTTGSPSATTCQSQRRLAALVADARGTLTLPEKTCWDVTTITIRGRSGLTIDGNGDTIHQPTPGPAGWSPIVQLYQDTDLTILDLDLAGASAAGGPQTEGRYGLVAEADSHLTLDQVDMRDVGGDFLALQPPNVHEVPIVGLRNGASSDVTVTDCDWTGAGYHGVTIEAVQGATFAGDTFADAAIDAIDMEYDGAYRTGPAGPGWPQTNIIFSGDTFASDGGPTLNVANTGSTPVDDLTFTGNKLTGTTKAIFDIAGVSGGDPVTDLAIVDNTATAATSGPDPNDTIHLVNVDGATVSGNTFPWYWYTQPARTAHLIKVAVIASHSTGVDVDDNGFVGALAPTSGTVATSCGNTYGIGKWQDALLSQAPCAS